MFRVKVCGLTEERGMEAAIAAGADAVGFNFWAGSPRCVTIDRARALVRRLPSQVETVGVFVNQPRGEVLSILGETGIRWAQFHGEETPAELNGFPHPWFPALRPAAHQEPRLSDWMSPCILIDAHHAVTRGGTGHAADWERAAAWARQRPLILAGGLSPETVAAAVARVRPAAVDLNSGVESAPGIKDPQRLSRALAALAGWLEGGTEAER